MSKVYPEEQPVVNNHESQEYIVNAQQNALLKKSGTLKLYKAQPILPKFSLLNV
jgi:hypothetical protein